MYDFIDIYISYIYKYIFFVQSVSSTSNFVCPATMLPPTVKPTTMSPVTVAPTTMSPVTVKPSECQVSRSQYMICAMTFNME